MLLYFYQLVVPLIHFYRRYKMRALVKSEAYVNSHRWQGLSGGGSGEAYLGIPCPFLMYAVVHKAIWYVCAMH
jgi:hypothetical protein